MSEPEKIEMDCLVCGRDVSDRHAHALDEFQAAIAPVSQRCPYCGDLTYLNSEWDSYVCPSCNEFLEPTCADTQCSYCSTRPARPVP